MEGTTRAPRYARQSDLDRLTGDVKELRDGLLGNELFPGGEIGRIKDSIAALPDVLDARDARRRTERNRRIATWAVGVSSAGATLLIALLAAHPWH